jgi:hypothetical protein
MEFQVKGITYSAGRVPALQQFHITRRIAPLIGELASMGDALKGDGAALVKPLAEVLARMSDADADYVLFGLLRHAKRQIPGGLGWSDVVVGTAINHLDISMPDMLQIAWGVLKHNMADFTAALPSGLLDKIKAQVPG